MDPMDDYSDDCLLDTDVSEKLYLDAARGMTSLFDGSLDSQRCSLPAFVFEQSGELQSSQGFQVFGLDVDSECPMTSLRWDPSPRTAQGVQQTFYRSADCSVGRFQTIAENVLLSNPTPHIKQEGYTTLILTEASSHFNPVRTTAVKPSPREIRPHPGQVVNQECSAEGLDDSYEGASSDERSERQKISPKQRGKNRPTSAITKEPVSGLVKVEEGEVQAGPDLSFKPSLDEILTEKKLALLRSPEVVKFMKQFQQQARQEKMSHQSAMKES